LTVATSRQTVATCRQTVVVFSRRCPPLGSGWLRLDGSYLLPDGGGFSLAAVHRLAADGYGLAVATCRQTVATCRQTVEVSRAAVHRLASGGYELTDRDPSNGFCCAIIEQRQRLSQKPTGVLALSLSLLPCLALSGFDSHLRRPQRGCDLHRTVPISTEHFRGTAGKSFRPGPCRCSDSDRRPGPREALPPASCPSGPSGAYLSSCGEGLANSIRLI
jgi:hypothetical protein